MVIVHMKQQMNRSKAHVSQLVKTGNRKARGGGGGWAVHRISSDGMIEWGQKSKPQKNP